MGQLAKRLEVDEHTVVIDSQNSVSSIIGLATDTPVKWFASINDLLSEHKDSPIHAGAMFVNVKNAQEDPKTMVSLKELFPVSPLFLLADSADDELTEAMAMGADDFLTLPIDNAILKTRFNVRKTAMARKASRDTISVGDIVVDSVSRTVSGPRGSKFFSNIEIRLITLLAQNFNKVVTREALKAFGWPNLEVTDNALNRKLYEIRLRINNLSVGINIRTLYGVGFVLEKTSQLE
jgi:DNA-binding response OmpR family regulator